MLRWWALGAAIFALAALVCGPRLAGEPGLLSPVLRGAEKLVGPFSGSGFLLALLFFTKNSSVAALALFAELGAEFLGRAAKAVLGRVRAPEKVVGPFLRGRSWAGWAGKLLPLVVLALNGAVVAAVCWRLYGSGVGVKVIAAGLLPHGVPELSALFLVCGAGVAGACLAERKALFLRVVLPLLGIAAITETWVTPLVMAAVS